MQALLESLKRETHPMSQRGNLSRLRGIAKSSVAADDTDFEEDYATYLTEKYQYCLLLGERFKANLTNRLKLQNCNLNNEQTVILMKRN